MMATAASAAVVPGPPVFEFQAGVSAQACGAQKSTASAPAFVKDVSFAPDGSCVLTVSEDARLRVYEVPPAAFTPHTVPVSAGSSAPSVRNPALGASVSDPLGPCKQWDPCLTVLEGELVYSSAWFPAMKASDPRSCVFASTSRAHPIHLWDAYTGALRATYRAYDHLDELVAAVSLCFNPGGDRLFAGYNRCVRVFDVHRPGRDCELRMTCKTKKARTGQRGLLSCIAFNPDLSGMYAVGSYMRSTVLYSESTGDALCELRGQRGGVTHLKFAPDGRHLFTGARKDNDILCWDIRKTADVVHRFARTADTNQRISFDIDASGRYLITGSADKQVHVYSTQDGRLEATLKHFGDAVSSVAFHPRGVLFAVGTGQRHATTAVKPGEDGDRSAVGASAGACDAMDHAGVSGVITDSGDGVTRGAGAGAGVAAGAGAGSRASKEPSADAGAPEQSVADTPVTAPASESSLFEVPVSVQQHADCLTLWQCKASAKHLAQLLVAEPVTQAGGAARRTRPDEAEGTPRSHDSKRARS